MHLFFFVLKEVRIEAGVHSEVELFAQVRDGPCVGYSPRVPQDDVASWWYWPGGLGDGLRESAVDLH
ncbi:hypothetical protein BL241_03745 [Ralstonia solanacearum]|uniref:Uncharacterized protein n=1 Tax=Ralstonia solanacearum TaxID=305 RepID=A0A0S4U4L8_RALSL|nr:hypothetical protein BL241_03745 [Ralstonia solanacearum]CUV16965.1 protein of unknown function [Ralstonia solanacearum]